MDIKILIDEEKIQNRVREVANQITRDYSGEEIVMICVLKGATFFAMDLCKRINLPMIIDFCKVSSYQGTESTGDIKLKLDITEDISNKNVIIVEDIVDTGRTLTFLKKYLEEKNPKSLRICSLLDKKERREVKIEPDYVCFNIPNKFVVGYGLDYDEKYRNLPYVGFIE